MHFLIESILVGFGIYSVFLSLLRKRLEKWDSQLISNIDKVASTIFSIGGLLFLGQWLAELLFGIFLPTSDETVRYTLINRAFGPYWLQYWLYVVFYLISTQILWIKKVRINNILRFIIGISMLISFEKLVIIITSLHKDYLPSSWIYSGLLISWLVYLSVFIFIVALTYLIKQKYINKKNV